MATGHRVSPARKAPPTLPKESVTVAPRVVQDRFGVQYDVIWDGRKTDPPLRDLHPNLLK